MSIIVEWEYMHCVIVFVMVVYQWSPWVPNNVCIHPISVWWWLSPEPFPVTVFAFRPHTRLVFPHNRYFVIMNIRQATVRYKLSETSSSPTNILLVGERFAWNAKLQPTRPSRELSNEVLQVIWSLFAYDYSHWLMIADFHSRSLPRSFMATALLCCRGW